MSQQGWIKTHRIIQEHWLWNDKPFSKGQAWIDLILLANHEDNKVPLGNQIILIKRGSFITSELKLMQRWGWGKSKTRAFLDMLQQDGMIIKKSDHKKTTLTIVKYNDYQDTQTTSRPSTDHNQTTARLLPDTNKNDKNVKNDKKNISSETSSQKFTPPSLEEVQAYCRERNNNVDAQRWHDFYLSKNWMIGKNKMKDWKAAVRTWEKNNKDKPSTPSPKSFNNFKNREYDTDELKKRLLAKSRGEKID